jgi:hypothetical protein
VHNDEIRVRHIRQEARAERSVIFTSHTLKTHRFVDQSDLQFFIPCDTGTYVNLDIRMSVWVKVVAQVGSSLDPTDSTSGI